MIATPTHNRVSAVDRQQALSKIDRILEMVEVLMLTANAAPDPQSKSRKVSMIRRHLSDLNELVEEHPFLPPQDRERFKALTSVLGE